MSKTKLFSLLVLGAISLGLVGCEQEQEKVVSKPQPPQQEVQKEIIFPYTEDKWLLEIQAETKTDEVKLEWFERIQEETKGLDYELMGVNEFGFDAWLVFYIDMTRDEYVTYAVNSNGKAFEDEYYLRDLSKKYNGALFDLIDSEGYTIYSYQDGESCIEVADWLSK